MNLVKQASVVSLFALMTAATASLASAQDSYGEQGNYCAKYPDRCGSQQMQRSDEEDQGYTKRRRVRVDEDQVQVQQSEEPRRHARSDWQFDPKKHRRNRHRSDNFRFELGGYWYPEPYWSYGIGRYRLGCGEGRAIVREH